MTKWGFSTILDKGEEDMIHNAMLTILREVGVQVENDEILDRLSEIGGIIDKSNMRIKFPNDLIENFIEKSEKQNWDSIQPNVEAVCSIHHGHYLNPDTNKYEPWNLSNVLKYIKVAYYLEHPVANLSWAFNIEDVDESAQLLFFHYLSFKIGGMASPSLNDIRWCPYIVKMCESAASETGKSPHDFFRGGVHLIAPLKFTRQEAEIFLYFANRGFKTFIGSMISAGGTGPVTLAGSLALQLSEYIFANIVMRTFCNEEKLHLLAEISPIDMKTIIYPYARPEKELCNVAMAQMARRYSAWYHPHTGHADASVSSVEAGFQKAANSIPTLMACRETSIRCGLLGCGELFSPIQLIIDNEITASLKRFARGFEVNDQTIAIDLIKEVGPGGMFLDTEHTVLNFRKEIWEPQLFNRQTFENWLKDGSKTDIQTAKNIYDNIISREPVPSQISVSLEKNLLEIIKDATGVKIDPLDLI